MTEAERIRVECAVSWLTTIKDDQEDPLPVRCSIARRELLALLEEDEKSHA